MVATVQLGKAEQKDSSNDEASSCCCQSPEICELAPIDGICLIETPDRRQRAAAWGPQILRIINRSGTETMLALTEVTEPAGLEPRKARAFVTNKARANSPVHHAFVRFGLRRRPP